YADQMVSWLFGPSFFKAVEEDAHSKDEVYRFFRLLNANAVFRDEVSDRRRRRQHFLVPFFLGGRRLPFYGLSNSQILSEHGSQELESFAVGEYLGDCIEKAAPETLYSWLLYLYNSFHWQGSTANGPGVALENCHQTVRAPFWDLRLVDFCSTMPEAW